MKKIPTIFKRNPSNPSLITDEHNPECAWVFVGEGIARRKYDGTCCKIDKCGKLWKRREIKPSQISPSDFICVDTDYTTGKRVGWTQVSVDSKEDRWHREAFNMAASDLDAGTYELCGPKVNGNQENLYNHALIRHDTAPGFIVIPTWDAIKVFLMARDIEGLVWHHLDGRMAKIKKRDFGLPRR